MGSHHFFPSTTFFSHWRGCATPCRHGLEVDQRQFRASYPATPKHQCTTEVLRIWFVVFSFLPASPDRWWVIFPHRKGSDIMNPSMERQRKNGRLSLVVNYSSPTLQMLIIKLFPTIWRCQADCPPSWAASYGIAFGTWGSRKHVSSSAIY